MACDLRPFRDYNEHDVINLFALSEGAGVDVTKGHLVKINTTLKGWLNASGEANTHPDLLGAVGTSGGTALGMMLYDVKENDENGEKLIFNPRKAAEMEVALSGQAVPILTRGIVLYSGSQLITDNPDPGVTLYSDNAGELTTTDGGGNAIGKTLGEKDSNGHVLVRISL